MPRKALYLLCIFVNIIIIINSHSEASEVELPPQRARVKRKHTAADSCDIGITQEKIG